MRGLRVLILVGATVSAMGAMWMMRSALQSQASLPSQQQQLAAQQPAVENTPAPTVQVLVADREIPTGRVMGPEDLRWQSWPAESVSPNFFTEGEDVEAIEDLTGSAARLVIVEGEPITSNKIVDLGGTGVLAALLRPGMRAISIPISEITGAGGFILPGDFVDILLTRQITISQIDEETGDVSSTSKHHQTETIMRTVRVLAIDQQLNETQNAAAVGNSATLELTPPVTVLDLHALVKQRLATASQSQENYLAYAKSKSEEAAAEAEAEAEVAEAPVAPVAAAPAAAAPVAAPAKPSTVTLIRNGVPIVVHTITPDSAGSQ